MRHSFAVTAEGVNMKADKFVERFFHEKFCNKPRGFPIATIAYTVRTMRLPQKSLWG